MKPLNRLALAFGVPLAVAATVGGAAAFAAQGGTVDDSRAGDTTAQHQPTSPKAGKDCPRDAGGSNSGGSTVSPGQY